MDNIRGLALAAYAALECPEGLGCKKNGSEEVRDKFIIELSSLVDKYINDLGGATDWIGAIKESRESVSRQFVEAALEDGVRVSGKSRMIDWAVAEKEVLEVGDDKVYELAFDLSNQPSIYIGDAEHIEDGFRWDFEIDRGVPAVHVSLGEFCDHRGHFHLTKKGLVLALEEDDETLGRADNDRHSYFSDKAYLIE